MIPMSTAREPTVQSSRYFSEIENFWKLASMDGVSNFNLTLKYNMNSLNLIIHDIFLQK